MSSPYIGEIRCFGFNFAPSGWAFCDGQLLPIAQNERCSPHRHDLWRRRQTTFALPNLRGRVPMHWGSGPGASLPVSAKLRRDR